MFQQLKNIYHLFQAVIANVIYGFPSRKIKVIGVSGTDGKTTTTHLIAHILQSANKKVSFISSVYAQTGNEKYDIGFHVTTPSPFAIQRYLRQAVENGDEFFILETTSHALNQNRVWGVQYEYGILTNVSHEHLDYHRTYYRYVKTKETLLVLAKKAVLNKADESYRFLSGKTKRKSIDYGANLKRISTQFKDVAEYNRYNYAAAYTVCRAVGLTDKEIFGSMTKFILPKGRFELIYDKNFKVIIDFAHTPNAFLNLLPSIRKKYLKNKGRLIHIFGSAGLRDRTKRPLMGKASSRFSDYIILTEEDYRTEDPNLICQQISSGILKNKPFEVIIDRERAIRKGLSIAKKEDIVVVTGKSHEKSICRGHTEFPWNENEAISKALSL